MNRVKMLLENNGYEADELEAVLSNGDKNYHTYTIEKRSKKSRRLICEPCDALKDIQYLILPLIMHMPVHRKCKAYEEGCSTRKNAKKHLSRPYILHTDIKNYFPSISRQLLTESLSKYFNYDEIDLLWRICSYNGGLPIGAPTSPFLSNRIMRKADKELSRLSFRIRYTRYADDLIFSSKKYIDKSIISRIESILRKYGLYINEDKTYFMNFRREVTGIILTNDNNLSCGTAFKKRLKSDIYNLLVKGEGKIDSVRGKLAYLRHIEPQYARTIINKYIRYDKISLFR